MRLDTAKSSFHVLGAFFGSAKGDRRNAGRDSNVGPWRNYCNENDDARDPNFAGDKLSH
jgi:hypothetical protein